MNIKRMFAHAIVRRVAFVIVAALFAFLANIGRADAHSGVHDFRSTAYNECMSRAAAYSNTLYDRICAPNAEPIGHYRTCQVNKKNPSVNGTYQTSAYRSANCISGDWDLYWTNTCPAGSPGWDEVNKKCRPSTAECLARNADLGANPARPSLVTERCVADCKFKMVGTPETSVSSISGGSPQTIYRGVMEYSGDACGTLPPSPDWDEEKPKQPPEQVCTPLGGGQTACRQPNGEVCHSAAHLRHICWKPGETGEKTDQTILQKTDAGPQPIPPNSLTLPSGDTLSQTGQPVTTTINNSTNTSTTTTTNYVTGFGTNAGTKNQGQPSTGTGTGSDSGGEAAGTGTATGGTCAAGWTCAGDPVNCAILQETHTQRCRGDGIVDALVSAKDDHGPQGQGSASDLFGENNSVGGGTVNAAGWLSQRSCPVSNIPGLDVDLAGAVCPGANVWGIYILIMAFMHAAHILGRAASGQS